jgi:flagellar biosynthesis chaperone FliJ
MTNSKYKEIVKVKKQKVREIENQLLDVRSRKITIEKKIKENDLLIVEFKQPSKGDFSQLQYSHHSFSMILLKKEELREKLELRIKQIEGLELLYKEANIEYEKMLHLHEEELDKMLQLQKMQESKDMDEIANILFVNKRKKEQM